MKYIFIFILFIICFIVWCFLKVASIADDEMEKDHLFRKR